MYKLQFRINNAPKDLHIKVNNKIILPSEKGVYNLSTDNSGIDIHFYTPGNNELRFKLKKEKSDKFFLSTFPLFLVNQNYVDTMVHLKISNNAYVEFDCIKSNIKNFNNYDEKVELISIGRHRYAECDVKRVLSKKKIIIDYIALIISFMPYFLLLAISIAFDLIRFDDSSHMLNNGQWVYYQSGKEDLLFLDIPCLIALALFFLFFIIKTIKSHKKSV